jgi:hypothetical protein
MAAIPEILGSIAVIAPNGAEGSRMEIPAGAEILFGRCVRSDSRETKNGARSVPLKVCSRPTTTRPVSCPAHVKYLFSSIVA